MTVPVRADLRAMEGYHSPQVDVAVRLNTNESPVPPPAAFREALADELADLAWHRYPDRAALELVDEAAPLVVTRTYSKTWSMAAARLGYLVGPAWLVEELEKVVLPYHLDAVTQAAGRLALRFTGEMEARVAELVEERGRLSAALGDLDVDVWPSGANFVLFRPRDIEGRKVWQALLERSVLVRDCSSWPRLEGCLRVTVGTRAEDDAFLQALEEII